MQSLDVAVLTTFGAGATGTPSAASFGPWPLGKLAWSLPASGGGRQSSGGGGEIRTRTTLRSEDFKSSAAASYATPPA